MLAFLEQKQKDGWDRFKDEIELYHTWSSKILWIMGVEENERYDELAYWFAKDVPEIMQ